MNQLFISRKQINLRDALLVAGAVVLVAYLVFRVTQASGAIISLVPDKTSVAPGSTVTVLVDLNSAGLAEGESINAVQVNMTYPQDLLEYTSIDATGSAFELPVQNTGGKGGVQIARGTLYPVTGDVQIAKINFKVKDVTGSASLGFGTGTVVIRASDTHNVVTTLAGTSIEVTNNPVLEPPTPTPTPPAPTPPTPTPVPPAPQYPPDYSFTPDNTNYSYNFPDSFSYSGFQLEPTNAPQAPAPTTDQSAAAATDTSQQPTEPAATGSSNLLIYVVQSIKSWYDSIIQSIANSYK